MAGTPLILRARTKQGLFKIQCLTCSSSLSDLKNAISNLTGIPQSHIKILKGYPPKPLEGSETTSLSALYVRDGDLLTIEESATATSSHSHSHSHSHIQTYQHHLLYQQYL